MILFGHELKGDRWNAVPYVVDLLDWAGADAVSAEAVKSHIRALISGEGDRILSDDRLVEILRGKGRRVGVVLSAGFFGFFGHAGFWKALCAAGISPRAWAGTSAGGMVAAGPGARNRFAYFGQLHGDKGVHVLLRPRRRRLHEPCTHRTGLDEALHPLTLLTFGMYGEVLPNQNGAPLRLVVPWKYGFKSAKSLVRIRFVEKQPRSSWEQAAPQEYGFYSNVNPNVDHPRWSQATERRIGEDKGGFGGLFAPKRKTLMFNGYDQVAPLYAGMDLRKNF